VSKFKIGSVDCTSCMAYTRVKRPSHIFPTVLETGKVSVTVLLSVQERHIEFRKPSLRAFGGSEMSQTVLDVSGACFIFSSL